MNSRGDLGIAGCHVSCGQLNWCAVADGGVAILLDLNSGISLKMWRNKCVKVVLRAQWLVTVEGSWEVVEDSSLVQCKTRFI